MKTIIPIILVATAMILFGCNDTKKTNNNEIHEHVDGDDHDHNSEQDHLHTADDGHNHKETTDHANEIVFTQEQAKAIGLKIEEIKPDSFYHVIKTSGQIQASLGDEQTVVATTNGIVNYATTSITAGMPIRNGESIVTISAKNLQDGDPMQKTRLAFENAQKEYIRAENLVKDKIISTKEFEQIKLNYENAKNSYQAQATNVTARGVRINSPINGYIKNLLVLQGEYVTVGQPIAVVTQNKRLQLRADVSEKNFKYLRNISDANFQTSYDNVRYQLSELNGKLLSYGKSSGGNSYYIPVTFEFDNVGDIVPGSYADVYLLTQPKDNIISVPISALTEEQGLYFVYLQIEPEAYKKQEVSVGQNNGIRVEILKGLQPGNIVVTNGVMQVKLAASSTAIPDGHNH